MAEDEFYSKGAVLSDCATYRYVLERHWNSGAGAVGFVMLNPSTADGYEDDRTIRRCVGFARDWGFCSMYVVNLMAFRTTYPTDIPTSAGVAVGPERDRFLRNVDRIVDQIICAWGASLPTFIDEAFITEMRWYLDETYTRQLYCLGRTNGGHPRHPLYLAKDTKRERFLP